MSRERHKRRRKLLHFKHQNGISSKYGFSGTRQTPRGSGETSARWYNSTAAESCQGRCEGWKDPFSASYTVPETNSRCGTSTVQIVLNFLSSHCSVLKSASPIPYNLNSPTADMPKLPIFTIIIFCLISTVLTAPDPTFTPPGIIV